MLRSLLHASSTCFANLSLSQTRIIRFRTITSFNLAKPINRNKTSCNNGSIADVLEILGPFHLIFPTSEVRLYVRLLRKSIRSRDSFMGSLVHAHVIKSGFDSDLLVSNVLLDMYAKAGNLEGCIKLFDEMPDRDLISWCTLISGYANHGFEVEAFGLFRGMHRSGVKPNHFVISAVLKACALSRISELGLLVHGLVFKSGLGVDRFVEIGLVDTYSKCGNVDDALKLFYEIPMKNAVSWNAMISGYVHNGFFIECVELCRDMCRVGFVMDVVTLRIVAYVVSVLEMVELCKNIHVYSIKIGLNRDNFVVSEMVRLLAKLGEMEYVGKLFSAVKRPDASLYSVVISGYHLNGYRERAVKLAEELLVWDSNPREGDLVSVLNLCLFKEEVTQIHAHVLKAGHISYISVGNALISMYAKLGEMVDADKIFQKMPNCDVVSWTAIMAGFTQSLQFKRALDTFKSFSKTGMLLDQYCAVTFMNICAGLQDISKGQQVHSLILKSGLIFSDFTAASLLHMYAKCGHIKDAARIFCYSMLPQNLLLTNVMLAGYCWNSQPKNVLLLFSREYRSGFIPDQFTYTTVLGACTDLQAEETGVQIHCSLTKSGFEFYDVIIGNAIINLYVRCGCITSACKYFYSMKTWNTSSYAMLMLGYMQNRCSSEALQLFCQMQQSGLHANPVTFARILRGCADLSAICLGKQIHASIIKMGLVSDVYIDNALVGMYAKSGDKDRGRGTLEDTTIRDDLLSGSINPAYSQDENKENNLKAFGLYTLEEVKQDHNNYADVKNLYASAASQIYETSLPVDVVQNSLKFGSSVLNSSNDLYKDCMIFQSSVFDRILAREVVLRNYMNSEHEENGCIPIENFEVVQESTVIPDQVVLIVFFGNSYLKMLDESIQSLKFVKISPYRGYGVELSMLA
ncbi:pentatricopeptide repeat-containing protein At4g18520, chloroplastic-like [Typha latifolia]|uniref:pentatricopeptide repeat-containing protein At4g18520, chloroplastic-like n=1 Tax=Typha latifolia TaxID=4733 RepID=UPI003C2B4B63